MGLCKSKESTEPSGEEGILHVMFKRFDKDNQGYISRENLQQMMKDDKTHFQGRDVDHILTKYGSDDKMTFDQFRMWWGSTYTTYNDDTNLARIVEEVSQQQDEGSHLAAIDEMEELGHAPHNTNIAISRS